jgi:hypothetical protein
VKGARYRNHIDEDQFNALLDLDVWRGLSIKLLIKGDTFRLDRFAAM